MLLKDNQTILFQGDSITDVGRDRDDKNSLGNGYPMLIDAFISSMYPEKNITCINKGISGNRVIDLKSRWEKDCIDLKPDWISILIGINDCWRRYDSNDPTSVEEYKNTYRGILNEIKEKTDAKIIMCEPFLLPTPEDRIQWREDLDPKIHAVRELAREFNAIYIPLDGVFAKMAMKRPNKYWTKDGVHPTMAGHGLIANEWLKALEMTK
jgi:lysophospholipase L1-like esterase